MKLHKALEETPFNMAMVYYLSLIKIIDKKDYAAVVGDILTYYKALGVIYRRVSFKLKKDPDGKDEETFLNKKFDDARNLLFPEPTTSRETNTQLEIMKNNRVPELLDEIDIKLWFLMDKYKMVFPDIKITGGLAGLAESYKLK